MTAAATFLFGVLVGWITLHLLIHRPDRHNRAIVHRAILDDLDEQTGEWAEWVHELGGDCAVYLKRIGELAVKNANLKFGIDEIKAELTLAERACDTHLRAVEREFSMPTIDGNRENLLDQIAHLPVGERVDFGDFLTEDTPIGLGVLSDHIASVTPIGKAKL